MDSRWTFNQFLFTTIIICSPQATTTGLKYVRIVYWCSFPVFESTGVGCLSERINAAAVNLPWSFVNSSNRKSSRRSSCLTPQINFRSINCKLHRRCVASVLKCRIADLLNGPFYLEASPPISAPGVESDKSSTTGTRIREIMFYAGLAIAFTVTALIIYTVCRLNRQKPPASGFCNLLCLRRRQSGELISLPHSW